MARFLFMRERARSRPAIASQGRRPADGHCGTARLAPTTTVSVEAIRLFITALHFVESEKTAKKKQHRESRVRVEKAAAGTHHHSAECAPLDGWHL